MRSVVQPVTLITGGSSGIGAALADEFAAHGHDLLLVARNAERLEAMRRELEARHPVQVHVVRADFGQPDAIETIEHYVAEQRLTVCFLVNNAGWGTIGPFSSNAIDDQLNMIDVNCRALVQLTRVFVPQLIANRGGILNVSSVAAFLPGPGMAVYFASKAFVRSLSESLAKELKPHGVRVTLLCPGPVATRFQARAGMMVRRAPRLIANEAQPIARLAYSGLVLGRRLVVPGPINSLLVVLGKVIPHRIISTFVARYHRLSALRLRKRERVLSARPDAPVLAELSSRRTSVAPER